MKIRAAAVGEDERIKQGVVLRGQSLGELEGLQAVAYALGAPVKAPRKKPAQLTPKSMELLRKEGWQVAVVEHWNSFVRIRQDLWGWCDVLGVGEQGTIAVQVCRRSDISTRARKIADSDTVAAVRKAGWRLEVHGWDLHAGRWRVERRDVS